MSACVPSPSNSRPAGNRGLSGEIEAERFTGRSSFYTVRLGRSDEAGDPSGGGTGRRGGDARNRGGSGWLLRGAAASRGAALRLCRGGGVRSLSVAGTGRQAPQLRSLMPWLVLAFLVWLVGYPLLVVAAEAFGIGSPGGGGPTTEAFRSFFTRADEWNAMWRTLWISVLSTLAAAAIGVPLGFLFERNEIPGRRPARRPGRAAGGAAAARRRHRLSLPLRRERARGAGAPDAGAGRFLASHRSLGDPAGPRVLDVRLLLPVHPAGLSGQDGAAIEAAQSLGASRRQILFRVTLPRLRPALAGATLLTFMTSLGSFSAPYIFGGGFRVMTTQIVASKLNGELRMAYVETTMLALLAFASLLLAAPDRSGPGPGFGCARHAACAQALAQPGRSGRRRGRRLGPGRSAPVAPTRRSS